MNPVLPVKTIEECARTTERNDHVGVTSPLLSNHNQQKQCQQRLQQQQQQQQQSSDPTHSDTFRISLWQAPFEEPWCVCASLFCCCCSQLILRYRVLNHVHPGSNWEDYECCQGYHHYSNFYHLHDKHGSRFHYYFRNQRIRNNDTIDDNGFRWYWEENLFRSGCCPPFCYQWERDCPILCACAEVILWPGQAALASSAILRQKHKLVLHNNNNNDDDDLDLLGGTVLKNRGPDSSAILRQKHKLVLHNNNNNDDEDLDLLGGTVLKNRGPDSSGTHRLLEGPASCLSLPFLCTVASILAQAHHELRFREGPMDDAPTRDTMER